METKTIKITIRLPKQDAEFAKAYAKAHGLTLTQVIDRYLRRLRTLQNQPPTPELQAITGLIPANIDAIHEHRKHLQKKHAP